MTNQEFLNDINESIERLTKEQSFIDKEWRILNTGSSLQKHSCIVGYPHGITARTKPESQSNEKYSTDDIDFTFASNPSRWTIEDAKTIQKVFKNGNGESPTIYTQKTWNRVEKTNNDSALAHYNMLLELATKKELESQNA